MSNAGMQAAAPAPEDDDDSGMDPGGADGAEGDEDGGDAGQEGTVIATIVQLPDGTWCLYHGDEPDEGDEGSEPSGGSEGGPEGEEGDENAPAMGAEPEGPMKEEFDNPGQLLKAVLDLLQQSESSQGGGEAAFESGFNENKNPTPKK